MYPAEIWERGIAYIMASDGVVSMLRRVYTAKRTHHHSTTSSFQHAVRTTKLEEGVDTCWLRTQLQDHTVHGDIHHAPVEQASQLGQRLTLEVRSEQVVFGWDVMTVRGGMDPRLLGLG